jgi:hypothetical protein
MTSKIWLEVILDNNNIAMYVDLLLKSCAKYAKISNCAWNVVSLFRKIYILVNIVEYNHNLFKFSTNDSN